MIWLAERLECRMATAAKVTDYPHIVKTPGVRAGKARIDGTRICVVDVAMAYQAGQKPEEIQNYFSSRPLTLAEVMSALAYHHDNPDELDDYLERSRRALAARPPKTRLFLSVDSQLGEESRLSETPPKGTDGLS